MFDMVKNQVIFSISFSVKYYSLILFVKPFSLDTYLKYIYKVAILFYWVTPVAQLKNSPANAEDTRDMGLIPGLGRSPGEGNDQPTRVFLPGKFQGQRSLVDYSPWSCKLSDKAQHVHVWAHTHTFFFVTSCITQHWLGKILKGLKGNIKNWILVWKSFYT